MEFFVVLAMLLALCLACREVIRKAPVVLYGAGVVLSVMYAMTSSVEFPFWLQRTLFFLMQKGTLAMALFTIVMFMGPFKEVGFVKRNLMPLRATLSILACILVLGHVVKYLAALAPGFPYPSAMIDGGFVVAVVCLALMLVLGFTSLQAIKKAMHAADWAKLQKLAYLFYVLVFFHIVLFLGPAAVGQTDGEAALSLVAYILVFATYAAARIGAAVYGAQKRPAASPSSEEADFDLAAV